jgi:hypothetical protein
LKKGVCFYYISLERIAFHEKKAYFVITNLFLEVRRTSARDTRSLRRHFLLSEILHQGYFYYYYYYSFLVYHPGFSLFFQINRFFMISSSNWVRNWKRIFKFFFPRKILYFYIRGRSILFQKMQHSSDFRLWPKTERGNICDDFYFSCLNHQSTILVSLFPISDPKLVIRMAQETTKRFSNYESGMVDQQFSLSTVYDIYISRLLPQRET